MKSIKIYNCYCIKQQKKENDSSQECYELFLSKNGPEIVGVDCGVASISSFKVNILLSSEIIRLYTEMTQVKPNNKVELGEKL